MIKLTKRVLMAVGTLTFCELRLRSKHLTLTQSFVEPLDALYSFSMLLSVPDDEWSHLQLNDALEHCCIALNDRAGIWNGASICVQLKAFWIVVGAEANEDANKRHKDDKRD